MIAFEVPGQPVGWQRSGSGKFAHRFTPKKTRVYERMIAQCCQIAMVGQPKLTGALAISITAFMGIPKSWSKVMRTAAAENRLPCTAKPDGDNILKAVCDALNGVAYEDDARITEMRVAKRYGDHPKIVVNVWQQPA